MLADPVILELHGACTSVRLPTGERLDLLKDAELLVKAGESVAVTGRSGSGKTTLLRALGLFVPLDEGTHRLCGVDVRSASDRRCSRLRARSIGFVFQESRLLPHLSAIQNVEYACVLAGIGRRDRRRAAEQALDAVGLSGRRRSRPAQLSGGEQQRVAIARALVKGPSLLLADEPTGALDRATADAVIDLLLGAVSRAGAGMVLVTHDEAVAARCDRRLSIEEGALLPYGVKSREPVRSVG